MSPILSICVPSRNRQKYFKETIDFLLDSPRDDVEFVFADNSDDPTIMNTFMAGISDARVKYLPSGTAVFSMKGNWERCMEATTGDWVSLIGDDDLIDPEVVHALKIAIALKPGLEAFSWTNINYAWATPDKPPGNVKVSMESTFHDMPQSLLFRRAFRWDDANSTLTSGFSVYHAAISRVLLERVKARFGGRYFEHPTIDYDNALKNVAVGKSFVYCRRPFSIFGSCPESNTMAAWNPKLFQEAVDRFKREIGSDYEADPWMKGFPFPAMLGMPASVAQVQQYLRFTYGVGMADWQPNFARSCAIYCSKFGEREDFDVLTDGFRETFARWNGGKFLKHFKPVFTQKFEGGIYTGLIDSNLYIDDAIGGSRSPTEFYRSISALLEKPERLVPELRASSKDSAVLSSLSQVA